jgi:hypothetical protein
VMVARRPRVPHSESMRRASPLAPNSAPPPKILNRTGRGDSRSR